MIPSLPASCKISTEHIVQDEWINFRKSACQFPDGIEELIYKGGFQQAVHVMAWLLAKNK